MQGRPVPVEIIEGREDFISPEVLKYAMDTATAKGQVHLPSWEHLVAMKAEAWYDRTGPMKRRFLEDLIKLRDLLVEKGSTMSRKEVRRIVALRPGRKHTEMLTTIERIFHAVLE